MCSLLNGKTLQAENSFLTFPFVADTDPTSIEKSPSGDGLFSFGKMAAKSFLFLSANPRDVRLLKSFGAAVLFRLPDKKFSGEGRGARGEGGKLSNES